MKFLAALVLLAFGITGCSNSRDAVHANENSATAQQRKEWQMQIEQRLKRIDREMDELVAKADSDANVARMKGKNRYYERMAELQKQRTDTRQKYESLRKTTNQKWEQLKAEVDKAADAMDQAWRNFLQELRS